MNDNSVDRLGGWRRMVPHPVEAVLARTGSRKILSIDGGGIRGLIALGAVSEIERTLRAMSGQPDLRLCDYFDLIAGTSTGAVIATGLSVGLAASEIEKLYVANAANIFAKSNRLRSLWYLYRAEGFKKELQRIVGEETLGSPKLRSLLLVVLRNATTDSPWVLTNNPRAKYNDERRPDCNLKLPLWQVVRASAAAPRYFPPEEVILDEKSKRSMEFVDGGTTPYNNPSFLAFLVATLDRYRIQWKTGVEKLLLVSVGTGIAPREVENGRARQMHILDIAKSLPLVQMGLASVEQDMLCRVFGQCEAGEEIDGEIDDLKGSVGPCDPKLFTYLRYNLTLTSGAFARYGLGHIDPSELGLDSYKHVPELQEAGRVMAGCVDSRHFDRFPPRQGTVNIGDVAQKTNHNIG